MLITGQGDSVQEEWENNIEERRLSFERKMDSVTHRKSFELR